MTHKKEERTYCNKGKKLPSANEWVEKEAKKACEETADIIKKRVPWSYDLIYNRALKNVMDKYCELCPSKAGCDGCRDKTIIEGLLKK